MKLMRFDALCAANAPKAHLTLYRRTAHVPATQATAPRQQPSSHRVHEMGLLGAVAHPADAAISSERLFSRFGVRGHRIRFPVEEAEVFAAYSLKLALDGSDHVTYRVCFWVSANPAPASMNRPHKAKH